VCSQYKEINWIYLDSNLNLVLILMVHWENELCQTVFYFSCMGLKLGFMLLAKNIDRFLGVWC
jgi:hypothetical protein